MNEKITKRIGRDLGVPDIVTLLAERLSGSDLTSLLLEVYELRAGKLGPQDLLNEYIKNRFVKPSDLDMIGLLEQELAVLTLLREHRFEPIALSPAAQWGSCSVVATASQKKIMSAIRNTEIQADATNALALHVAANRKKEGSAKKHTDELIRYCTVHRHIRAQEIKGAGFTPHFKVGCMVIAGRDKGNYLFECEATYEQLRALSILFRDVFGIGLVRFKLQRRGGYNEANPLAERVLAYLQSMDPMMSAVIEEPAAANTYYKGIQFKMIIEMAGREWEIADGGFVDWTQQLLGDKKERFMISGFGFDLMYRLKNNLL